MKSDGGKLRLDLVPPELLYAVAKVLTYGATKYSARTWEKGIGHERLFGALQRHLWAWQAGFGEANDEESGMPHLYHAACCMAMLLTETMRRPDLDDRHKNLSSIHVETLKARTRADLIQDVMHGYPSIEGCDCTKCNPMREGER